MKHHIYKALACISLTFFICNSVNAGCSGNDTEGICSHNHLDQVVNGSNLHLKWNLKSGNRDRVVVTYEYVAGPSGPWPGPQQDEFILDENWAYADTPEEHNWLVPCDATGAIVVTVKTYNRWFLGAGQVYALKETYSVTLGVRAAYFANPGSVVLCKPEKATLHHLDLYPGYEPTWYLGIGTGPTNLELGTGLSLDYDFSDAGEYAFTVAYKSLGHQCGPNAMSFPAIYTVSVLEEIDLLKESYPVDDDPAILATQSCSLADFSMYHIIDQTALDLADINNQVSNIIANTQQIPGMNFSVASSYGDTWSPDNYRYDGTLLRVCSWDMQQADTTIWEFLRTTSMRLDASFTGPQHIPAFVPNKQINCDIPTRWVEIYRAAPGRVFPQDSVITEFPEVLTLDSTLECDRGNIKGILPSDSMFVIGPPEIEGDKENWTFTWDPAPGLVQKDSINPVMLMDSVVFDEFGNSAATYYATAYNTVTEAFYNWCTRVIHGEITVDTSTQRIVNPAPIPGEARIFPNPSAGDVSISTKLKLVSIKVFNLAGVLMLNVDQSSFNGGLATGNLPPGMYVVAIETEEGQLEKHKFIKL